MYYILYSEYVLHVHFLNVCVYYQLRYVEKSLSSGHREININEIVHCPPIHYDKPYFRMKYLHVDFCGIFEYYKNRSIDHYTCMLFHTLAGYLLNLPFKILCKLLIVAISIYFMLPTTITVVYY